MRIFIPNLRKHTSHGCLEQRRAKWPGSTRVHRLPVYAEYLRIAAIDGLQAVPGTNLRVVLELFAGTRRFAGVANR
ncbi:MAG: hypothetical protein ACYS74_08160 [Planctomycetota bacterium]